MLDSLCTRELF